MSEKDSCIVLCLKLTDCGVLDVDDDVVGIDPLVNDTTESLPCVC